MNKVIIKSMDIKNFKGIESFNLNFDDGVNRIYAPNGYGKTTIKNAWEWVLCHNVKDYLPNFGNKELKNVDTSVKIILNINDLEYTLKRESLPKYNSDGEKIGNKNIYTIDDIEYQEGNYIEKIANLLGNSSYENLVMLTSKDYFNSDTTKWGWNNRRKFLTNMIDSTNEMKILLENEKYKSIRDYLLKGYSMESIETMLEKEKKSLREKQNSNKILIESKQSEITEYLGIDFDVVSQQLSISKTKYTKLLNNNKKTNQSEELTKLSNELVEKSKELTKLKTIDVINQKDLSNERLEIYKDATETKSNYDTTCVDIKTLEKANSQLMEQKIIDTCPTCKQKLPAEDINKAKNEIKLLINNNQEKITQLKSQAKELYLKYNSLIEKYTEIDNKIKNFVPNESIKVLQNEIKDLNLTIDNIKQKKLNNLSNQTQKELEDIISRLEKEMAKKDYLEKGYKQIQIWKKDSGNIADNIIEIENKIELLESFSKELADININKVNNLFKNGVSWSLYQTNYKGKLEETCVCLYNNKRYSASSKGEKHTANIEIIKTLQNYFNVSLPLFEDDSESITIETDFEGQRIELYATIPVEKRKEKFIDLKTLKLKGE